MKKTLLLLSILLCLTLAKKTGAQNTRPVFKLKQLPATDTLLSGWNFHPGDNPQWAQPGLDDSKWTAFDPSKDINTLNAANSIFWLRLHLMIDSSIKDTTFAFRVDQNVASVIYLDGKPFKSYGSIGQNVTAFNPDDDLLPVTLSRGEHTIAVKIALQKGLISLPISGYETPIFNLNINTYSAALTNYSAADLVYQRNITENLVLIGIFFILTITHFVSFGYYRKQRAHIYYAIVTLILLIDTYINFLSVQQHSPVLQFWLNIVGLISFTGFVFLPLTIYALFDYKRRIYIKVIMVVSALSLCMLWFNSVYASTFIYVGIPLINAAECVRVGIWGWKNKKKGALFITAGSFLFLSLLVIQNLIEGGMGDVLFVASLLSLPVGMTIFLAIQTAITHRSLEAKFAEVQELSQKNLEYQMEKQQMLARQNEMLEQQVNERTAELNQSLTNLKQTQAQLIQSEKMASLGELTAGIAHEIQNPLNFVNNFSEVSIELLEELQEEAKAGNNDEVIEIAGDLTQNLQKINHHGKRADAIVKGMLQHSKSGSGVKEATDINVLADEFLKLSYHGLRAKDKNFNAELITHFAEGMPKVKLVQQEIGRVLLNLFNNAFYAVNQKQKTVAAGYKPTIELTTRLHTSAAGGAGVAINVRDNGSGIPDAIKDKIMQPFFTTKPTGEGTGLGLSLSYDIVVKGHGGTLDLSSIEGEGTEFTIWLPLS